MCSEEGGGLATSSPWRLRLIRQGSASGACRHAVAMREEYRGSREGAGQALSESAHDVMAEHVVAVAVVVPGTLLNGWRTFLPKAGNCGCGLKGTLACGQVGTWSGGRFVSLEAYNAR